METPDETTDRKTDYSLERWIVFFLTLLFLLPFVAQGQESPGLEPLPTATLAEVGDAALLLETSTPGLYAIAPTVSTEIEINVTGPIVRARVRQTFRNTTAHCAEGLYLFPLPEAAAVDSMRMTIGSRLIVGEIREREEAKRQYQKARSEGRKAALLEQHRPNVFTTSVATLLPGDEAVIEIEYQETAHYDDGEYRLRFPMVVAPRYTPRDVDPDFIGPQQQLLSNVTMSVDLRPGYSVGEIHSAHHRISAKTAGHRHYQLTLDPQEIAADRDFELTWRPDLGSRPAATVLSEQVGQETYALLLVTPPPASPMRVPRETVFIIDSSGSMEGASMEQAREALLLALDDLRPGDTFNVIDFDSQARALFTESRIAQMDTIAVAKEFVTSLSADGGTEMLAAIQLALPGRTQPGVVRQVIFMTDGQVGNEQQLFGHIQQHLGDSRLFTIGIGSAPNSYFMRNAARFGRGTFTYIGDLQQVRERMGALFEKLSSPVMTSIEVDVHDRAAEVWPERVPDLYRGEPLIVAVRLTDPASPIVLRGRIGSEPWSAQLTLPPATSDSGIGKLWARQKIESAMDRLSAGASAAGVRTEVVTVALRHHLVSQYTSLVAIDHSPAGVVATACKPAVALEPAETSVPNPPGTLPQTATPGPLLLIAGALMVLASAALAKRPW